MKVHSSDLREHPDGPKQVPDVILSEGMAQHNHGQSLKGLNGRGGMSYAEIYCNIKGLSLRYIEDNPNFDYRGKIELIISMMGEE